MTYEEKLQKAREILSFGSGVTSSTPSDINTAMNDIASNQNVFAEDTYSPIPEDYDMGTPYNKTDEYENIAIEKTTEETKTRPSLMDLFNPLGALMKKWAGDIVKNETGENIVVNEDNIKEHFLKNVKSKEDLEMEVNDSLKLFDIDDPFEPIDTAKGLAKGVGQWFAYNVIPILDLPQNIKKVVTGNYEEETIGDKITEGLQPTSQSEQNAIFGVQLAMLLGDIATADILKGGTVLKNGERVSINPESVAKVYTEYFNNPDKMKFDIGNYKNKSVEKNILTLFKQMKDAGVQPYNANMIGDVTSAVNTTEEALKNVGGVIGDLSNRLQEQTALNLAKTQTTQTLDKVTPNVTSVILGNKTAKGGLDETFLDKTVPAVRNVLENLTQESIQTIVKSEKPAEEFANTMNNNFKDISTAINNINNDAYNKGITINTDDIKTQAKNSELYQSYKREIADDIKLGNTPNPETVKTLEKLDKILEEYGGEFTISKADNYRRLYNEKLKAFYNGKSTESNPEIAFRKILTDGLRSKQYDVLDNYYQGYKDLAGLRADYTSLVNPVSKMRAREQNQFFNGLSGNSIVKQILRGALDTIDITDGIYLFTNGGATRTAVEMLFGGFQRGVKRYNTTNSISRRLRNALSPLNKVDYQTQAIPNPKLDQENYTDLLKQRVSREYLYPDEVLQLPLPNDINMAKNKISSGRNVFSTLNTQPNVVVTPYSEVTPQSPAGERYSSQIAEQSRLYLEQQAQKEELLDELGGYLDVYDDEDGIPKLEEQAEDLYKQYYGVEKVDYNSDNLLPNIEELYYELEDSENIEDLLANRIKVIIEEYKKPKRKVRQS